MNVLEDYVRRLRETRSPRKAARLVGATRAQVEAWARDHDSFREAVRRALRPPKQDGSPIPCGGFLFVGRSPWRE